MKWRYVFGCAALIGLAYLLPFVGLPVVGVLVGVLSGYLLALALTGGLRRAVPAAIVRSRETRLRNAWREALDGGDLPSGAPMASRRASAAVHGRPLAGGPVWVRDTNQAFKHALAWAMASSEVDAAAGEWVVTDEGFFIVMPTGGVVRLPWADLRTLSVLRPAGGLTRGVYVATHDGRTAQLGVDPAAAEHLQTILGIVRGRSRVV